MGVYWTRGLYLRLNFGLERLDVGVFMAENSRL